MKFKLSKGVHAPIIKAMTESLPQFKSIVQASYIMDVLEALEATHTKTEKLNKIIVDKVKSNPDNVEMKDGQEVWSAKGMTELQSQITELYEGEEEYDFPQIEDYSEYPMTMVNAIYLLRNKLFKVNGSKDEVKLKVAE